MSNEIDNFILSFRAVIAEETIKHRGHDAGLVSAFTNEVRAHEKRYLVKCENLRALNVEIAGLAIVEQKIKSIAQTAIDAATAAGRVELAE